METAHAFTCARCSQPLPPAPGSVLKCPSCGEENRIADDAPVPQPEGLVPKAHRVPLVVIVAASAVVLAVVGLMVASSSDADHDPPPARPPRAVKPPPSVAPKTAKDPSEEPQVQIYGSSGNICFIDANRDGVLDVAGVGSAGFGQAAVAIDGRDGRLLWKVRVGPETAQSLHCIGDVKLLASHGNTRLDRLDAAAGRRLWSVMLSAPPAEIDAGPGCFVVRTRDGRSASYDYATGRAAPCKATTFHEGSTDARDRWAKKGVTFGDTTIRVTRKGSGGAERFVVEGLRGARAAWSKRLEIEPDAFVSPVIGPDGVLVAGHRPGDTSSEAWAYVKTSGDVGFAGSLDGESFGTIAIAQNKVLMLDMSGLRAYELASGKLVWKRKNR